MSDPAVTPVDTTGTAVGLSALEHALARRTSADGDLVSGAYVHNSGPCLFRPRRPASASAPRLTDTKS
ncbi:hypothetical protein [Pseudofrankia asymbiotica]|uniref:Uncharacterized protein n=1 Tax=Pseudofrankia asymbiotica TaxID=1834516 RepID=A0A1V2I2K6_9ACTN|nr:hypothetical protein [Pseudofrankia asymbiotica]ONH24360.1 hypothetical protein BL253_30550 [Pseudofrankia asymbiotica]